MEAPDLVDCSCFPEYKYGIVAELRCEATPDVAVICICACVTGFTGQAVIKHIDPVIMMTSDVLILAELTPTPSNHKKQHLRCKTGLHLDDIPFNK